ncbi:MAG: O-antigen ligase family protein [Sedimentisphaerales bacterium]|nr:O-antigen ligase family protein [Sedimentisphaerales bacterium]
MGLRIIALYLFVAFLVIYAWKDWFKSLCGLIFLMAVIEHEDMPKSMFGIQGLNTWNMLFLGIFAAWLATRRRDGLKWDMPGHLNILLMMYFGVIFFGFLRAVFDRSYIENYPVKSLVSEELINTVKWTLPGVLLFDGCRNRKSVILAVCSLLGMYFLLAVQVIRRIPPSTILSGGSIELARNRCSDIGYSAVDMSVFLAGASWAIIAVIPMFSRKKYKAMILAAAGMVVFAQALTGGRAGYVAWGATGFSLCLIKWRKYLLLAPVVAIILPIVFPGAVDRMFTGFGETDVSGENISNENAITSDRMVFWPYVTNKIGESPLIGYGRLAMRRTGLVNLIESEHPGIGATQPHNMYLETLFDNGIIGSIPIILFWLILVIYAGILFRSSNRLCSAAGGVALSLMLAQLFAGIGSQHFYPEESTLGAWAAMFLMLRVYIEHKKSKIITSEAVSYENEQLVNHQTSAAYIDY